MDINQIILVIGKVVFFFSVTLSIGLLLYPRLTFPLETDKVKALPLF